MGFYETGFKVGFLCIEGDCKQGEALVTQMRESFAQLMSSFEGDKREEFKRRFFVPVHVILKSFNDENGKFSRKLPFSPVCCTILEIGRQAQALSQKMLAWSGREPLQDVQIPESRDIGKVVITLAAITGGVILLPKVLESLPRRR